MRKVLLSIALLTITAIEAAAIDNNTVQVVFNGSGATVTIASNIKSFITDKSSGSHVKLVQSELFQGNSVGEITYVLSGSSTDGEFYLEGAYKCSVELNGLTLTNPSGPAVNIQNGKRIKVSAKSGTTTTLTDGPNETYNGCLHVKGHTEFKGKGTLNVIGKSRHAIYSKEYVQVKNLTINVTSALKDGIHCKEYFLLESGTVNISGVQDDGIQVELDGNTSTGVTADHEDEDTGNFYMLDGTLNISSFQGLAVKADGTITFTGGKRNFSDSDILEHAGIGDAVVMTSGVCGVYDLSGHRLTTQPRKGVVIVKENGQSKIILTK